MSIQSKEFVDEENDNPTSNNNSENNKPSNKRYCLGK